jgi:DUF1680 family protein
MNIRSRRIFAFCLAIVTTHGAVADEPLVIPPHARLAPLPLKDVKWTSGLMAERFETCRTVTIPSMWHLMKGTEPTQFFQNFRIAAGLAQGVHRGPKFNDGDFYKWIEAAAATLATRQDPELDSQLEGIIDVLARAQRADGYLHTPVLIKQRAGVDAQPLANPLDFEMYNLGHLITAGCVHHRATGKDTLLRVARKAADYLAVAFARPTPELARHGICPAHYMALVDLYRTTGDAKYLNLARALFDMRDLVTDGTDDNQDRMPFRKQATAVGHAVRANYLYAGAADILFETGDVTLLGPLQNIWTDLAAHKLYITGGCGALYDGASPAGTADQKSITRIHQAYGMPYQLPNAAAHNETCAGIGSVLWNWRMLLITADARYADALETALYNSVLSGISLDGKSFFYTNPLRITDPMPVNLRWSRTRQPFMSVFCCPPNVARTIAESAGFAYAQSDRGIYLAIYGSSVCDVHAMDGGRVQLEQTTNYPWDGKVRLALSLADGPREFSLMLRIPGWTNQTSAKVNGQTFAGPFAPSTFLEIRRRWATGDVVDLELPMPPRLVEANPLVEETLNQLAVARGPLVYCVESADLPSGSHVMDLRLPRDAALSDGHANSFFPGAIGVTAKALITPRGEWTGRLYRDSTTAPAPREIDLTLTPYFAWANRGPGEMTVWLPAGR